MSKNSEEVGKRAALRGLRRMGRVRRDSASCGYGRHSYRSHSLSFLHGTVDNVA